jgi:hypothetical protein
VSLYEKGRHYVKVQKMSEKWDEDTVGDLQDEIDPETGEPAYRIDFDGDKGGNDRRLAGKRGVVVMSCSQDYIDRVTVNNSRNSLSAMNHQPHRFRDPRGIGEEFEEEPQVQSPMAVADIAAQRAQQMEREGLAGGVPA